MGTVPCLLSRVPVKGPCPLGLPEIEPVAHVGFAEAANPRFTAQSTMQRPNKDDSLTLATKGEPNSALTSTIHSLAYKGALGLMQVLP